jgi:hypothetical protein
MSYCVNCGVKLDQSLEKCPLCTTIVINPAIIDLKSVINMAAPDNDTFPKQAGKVEEVNRRDLGLLISIILGGIAISALLLNIFLFKEGWWSLLIIGVCVILFFLALPAFILTKTPIYISLLFDSGAIALYLFFISLVTPSSEWFSGLALPIVILLSSIILSIVWLIRTFKSTMLMTALYVITGIALLCAGLELLIDRYAGNDPALLWSAIVLTVCAVIDAGLITVLSRRRLRDAVQKRLHF